MILPAAGFGRRAGIDGSKELLPGSQGKPLIEFHLTQARIRQWPVHIITRREKTDLIRYLEKAALEQDIEIQLIESSREWPDTLLQSERFWREKNILCLPDTEFAPTEILDQLSEELNEAHLLVAQFSISNSETKDLSSWGYIQSAEGLTEICEKPAIDAFRAGMQAWGLIGFQKAFGKALFNAQLESTFDHKWKQIEAVVLFLNLQEFKDATRKKIL